MTDDFTNIETGASCYVFSSPTTIYSYKANTRTSYIQVGGKWYKSSISSYYSIPDSAFCYTYDDITKVNTNAAYYPIFEFIALLLAVFVWFFVFRLFSRLIRWRI